jgi:hypothetical protein
MMNFTHAKTIRRGLAIGACSLALAGTGIVAMGGTAGAQTDGQISVQADPGDKWTVTGSGFAPGQQEIVEVQGSLDESVSVTASALAALIPVGNTQLGLPIFKTVPAGSFTVQLSGSTMCMNDVFTAYMPLDIEGHATLLANSNTVSIAVLC